MYIQHDGELIEAESKTPMDALSEMFLNREDRIDLAVVGQDEDCFFTPLDYNKTHFAIMLGTHDCCDDIELILTKAEAQQFVDQLQELVSTIEDGEHPIKFEEDEGDDEEGE